MNETSITPDSRSQRDTQLHGRLLLLARVTWGVVALLTVVVFLSSLPVFWTQLQIVCTGPSCSPVQPSPDAARSLRELGLTLEVYASYQVALQVFVVMISWVVATVLFWRKSDDWLALLAGLFLITEFPSTQNGPLYALLVAAPTWSWAVNLVLFLGLLTLCFFCFLFPDGSFVPPWTGWLAMVVLAFNVPQSFFPGVPGSWPDVLSTIGFFALVVAILLMQSYRYWRVSTRVQRQQTKWVVLALVVVIVIGTIPPLLVPSLAQAGTLGALSETSAFTLVLVLIPISIGISILRYRLWDIDLIINRTLVYSALTALLTLIYLGLILILQALTEALTGQVGDHPILIVGSTLVIAALFQPLRRRIQNMIDRRFYRRKYDATKTLEAFSATLRNEVDLSQLSEHLLNVVQETMQPAHVTLWLRRSDHEKKSNTQE